MNTYSLDEAAEIIRVKHNIPFITARKIRDLAINKKISLCFLFDGIATKCVDETEEEIYGYIAVMPRCISKVEMEGSCPANMFSYKNCLYKILSPNKAVTLTADNLLVDDENIDKLSRLLADTKDSGTHQKQIPKSSKLRQNILDHVIDKAIEETGSLDANAIYLKLKDFALDGVSPFTGETKEALFYTNDNDEIKPLTKDALSKRLKRR